MSLNFEQIIVTAYRQNFIDGQFSLYDNGEGVYISSWNVPNIPEPTYNEVMAMDTPEIQHMHSFYIFVDKGALLLSNYIDSIAQQKQYANAVSCASYSSSTVLVWKAQADAFIAWRDSVYIYVIQQEELMISGQREIPSFEGFKTELPTMIWP